MTAVKVLAPPPLDEREIRRYAGCRDKTDALLDERLATCIQELLPLLHYTVCMRQLSPAEITSFTMRSEALARHLASCERVMLLAATLGVAPDRLVVKYGQIVPSKAVLIQAVATERIEALCQAACRELERETGLSATKRFSPGYGDLPLDAQRDVFALLSCEKHLGVTLNDSLLMSPSKSVTAFVGLR